MKMSMKIANVTITGVDSPQRYVPVHGGTGLIASSGNVVAISPCPSPVIEFRCDPSATVARPEGTLVEEPPTQRQETVQKLTGVMELQ
jgi:hypothetical protein